MKKNQYTAPVTRKESVMAERLMNTISNTNFPGEVQVIDPGDGGTYEPALVKPLTYSVWDDDD